ncbi:heme anaerobic degradation radical SAM methyltransferase ChuW/HutW [Corallincola holothuriorum]|uniref:Heme anaerobic degradation radical SAM methyltransferase ChuW/HutW n=1 Tax=Corallincola holothuriorum TaxID=2282215 RepID=A0A368N8L9_9GAMM|nr:heme anaerobic degradation radical SAM methyltransferase ChuW/HutW [Corallincola holothuriorum]RCU45609.1 heme anaerobic degradation radical SAM methyltransferase ChuW/HutW [Corallincola holothuriorum]
MSASYQHTQSVQPTAPSPTLTEDMTGRPSPSPLQYAFSGKTSAHAGRGGQPPFAAEVAQQQLTNLFGTPVKAQGKRALYVHIPFCRVRCSFCNFFKYASSPQLMEQYFQCLLVDLERKAAQPWSQSQPFDAVYIGGGTPTDLTAEQIYSLGERIRAWLPLRDDCEITLEGRLNKFNQHKFERALAGGFNRFSFGVQSFDTQVRKAAKRLDDRETLLKQLKSLTASNSATIAIDLMYGLPHQTTQSWQQDLEDTLESGVDGVDLYQLLNFQGTGIQRALDNGQLDSLMDTPQRALLYRQGADYLNQAGLKQLSYCHWASTDKERSRYNRLAKSGAEILAVGAGAGGNIGGLSYMQPRDIEPWQTALEANQWPVAMMMAKGKQHQRNARIVGACDQGAVSAELLGEQRFKHAIPLFSAWQQNGLAMLDDEKVTLTLAGQFWSVNMANGLLAYLNENPLAA